MSDRPRASKDQQGDFAERMPEDFEATILHNVVYDEILEDVQLARLCDAEAIADEAAAVRANELGEDVDFIDGVDEAKGKLGWTARQRAIEVVAEACAFVIREADDWDDAYKQGEIDDARREATQWLRHHSNEAERADVMGALKEAPEVDI